MYTFMFIVFAHNIFKETYIKEGERSMCSLTLYTIPSKNFHPWSLQWKCEPVPKKDRQCIVIEGPGVLLQSLASAPLFTPPKCCKPTIMEFNPSSLLKQQSLSIAWMCNASFTRSFLRLLARSTTCVSLHSIGWLYLHACSAIADFSDCPRLQASLWRRHYTFE